MIECEKCGDYFHADDISICSECGLELCEECFQVHFPRCRISFCNCEDEVENGENEFPRECPHCGEELELSHDYDGNDIVGTLCCPNSDCEENFQLEYSRVSEKEAVENVDED